MDDRNFGPRRTLVSERAWDWQLLREADGSLLLSVLCGTIGVFELEVPFDSEKVASYDARGETFLDELAAHVRYSPNNALSSGLARPGTSPAS